MEARLKRVEDDVVEIRLDVHKVREDVHGVRETVLLLEERQARLHSDITSLTEALGTATNEVTKLNQWVNKRGAFFAGATFILGVIASVVTGILAIMKDWFTG